MFGHHKRKREKKRLKRAQEELKNEKEAFEAKKPGLEKAADAVKENETAINVKKKTNEAREDRNKAKKEGKDYAEEVINRDVQGLSPEKRHALQYEANRNIDRSMETANRKLLGDQSQRGITGKSGVGYAQQRDLNRMGMEAQSGVHRDLDKLNSDLSLKKLAAMYNIEQGEAAQAGLDKQLAVDELQLADERKRARQFEDQINKLFSRV